MIGTERISLAQEADATVHIEMLDVVSDFFPGARQSKSYRDFIGGEVVRALSKRDVAVEPRAAEIFLLLLFARWGIHHLRGGANADFDIDALAPGDFNR